MKELTLTKQNATERHYSYNGKYAGYIDKAHTWGSFVYYVYPA